MTLAEEIRQKYAAPYYTFDDVVNEIRKHVFSTYEYVAAHKFSEWPAFNVCGSDGVPQMRWKRDSYCNSVHWLCLPRNSFDFNLNDIQNWFKMQGFVKTTDNRGNFEGWRIKF